MILIWTHIIHITMLPILDCSLTRKGSSNLIKLPFLFHQLTGPAQGTPLNVTSFVETTMTLTMVLEELFSRGLPGLDLSWLELEVWNTTLSRLMMLPQDQMPFDTT